MNVSAAGTGLLLVASLCVPSLPIQAKEARAETVGRSGENEFVTPVNQRLTPTGLQVDLPGMRPQGIALSPNGKLLITAGETHELVVLDPSTGSILQHVPLPPDKKGREPAPVSGQILQPDTRAQLSFTGLTFSPDGLRIYLSNINGDIKVFAVEPDHKVSPLTSFDLPAANAPRRSDDIPAGIALSRDSQKLYVALNLSNRLMEMDAVTGRVLRIWDVGVAPYDVVLARGKAYVSNWGGRRPDASSITGPAGQGTLVRVDPTTHTASESSVSIIALDDMTEPREMLMGLHTSAMALSPNGRFLVVANSGSDTLAVIDTRSDKIVETIWARQNPADLFGAQPNALAFDRSGKKLFVCNGTQNAVGVIEFKPGNSKLLGLIPVGWFPAAIAYEKRTKLLCVANLKGFTRGRTRKAGGQADYNSLQWHGTLSLVRAPKGNELTELTGRALANMRYPLLAKAKLLPQPGKAPCPVPERVGEPSVFKHVIYIIKENRTYDQVLGDIKEGNGEPSLCTFGERFTPNQHKLVREFVLLDNTYCSGSRSSDGHQY